MTKQPIDPQARALLDALNELFDHPWEMEPGDCGRYAFTLKITVLNRKRPFRYDRTITVKHIEYQPFRTAQRWREDITTRLGDYIAIRQEPTPF